MNLNLDCQLLIIENAHIYDLINLSEVNKHFQFVVEDVLKRKFAKHPIAISYDYTMSEPEYPKSYKNESEDRIDIYSVPVLSRVFRKYGHLIRALNIFHTFELNKEHAQMMYRDVLYCSDTLNELLIFNRMNDMFAEFNRPFKKLEHLRLEGSFKRMNNSNLNFAELFPSLRKLTLQMRNIYDLNISDYKYPFLECLSVDSWSKTRVLSLKKLIQNHSEIRSLHLTSVDGDLFQFVADRLPNIEMLDIGLYEQKENSDWPYRNVNFHFENIKSATLNGYTDFLANITFGNSLQTVIIDGFTVHSTELIEMALKYRNSVRKLHLNYAELNNAQVLQLANADLSLDEMKIKCGISIEMANIFELIDKLKERNLQKFILFIIDYALHKLAMESLRKRYEPEWIVTKGSYDIYLERN